tara:strand:+ start:243 stop:686 length:444 start_codon:yes stop_codon:yes gene_type:complete
MEVEWTPETLHTHLRKLRSYTAASKDIDVVPILALFDGILANLEAQFIRVRVDLETNDIDAEGIVFHVEPRLAEFCFVLCKTGYASYEQLLHGIYGSDEIIVCNNTHPHVLLSNMGTLLNKGFRKAKSPYRIRALYERGYKLCRENG